MIFSKYLKSGNRIYRSNSDSNLLYKLKNSENRIDIEQEHNINMLLLIIFKIFKKKYKGESFTKDNFLKFVNKNEKSKNYLSKISDQLKSNPGFCKYHSFSGNFKGVLLDYVYPKTDLKKIFVSDKYLKKDKSSVYNLNKNDDAWRLFVDGRQQINSGPYIYDNREKGCIVAMANALLGTLSRIDSNLSFSELIKIHEDCINKVSDLECDVKKEKYRKSENSFFVKFGLDTTNSTPEGIKEACKSKYFDKIFTIRNSQAIAIAHGEQLKNSCKEVLDEYNNNIIKAKSPLDKLREITKLVSTLEKFHPFSDANCRTFCTILLNRELIKNGFSPVILDDPNKFDGYGINGLIQQIIKGFENFNYVLENGKYPKQILRLSEKDINLAKFVTKVFNPKNNINNKRRRLNL